KDEYRTSFYTTFITMQCFLSKTEFAILNNTIRKQLRNMDQKIVSIKLNTILAKLGFPNNWQNQKPLKQ
ncbi:MAG: Abi family protein, partial [Lactobacillus sp.]